MKDLKDLTKEELQEAVVACKERIEDAFNNGESYSELLTQLNVLIEEHNNK